MYCFMLPFVDQNPPFDKVTISTIKSHINDGYNLFEFHAPVVGGIVGNNLDDLKRIKQFVIENNLEIISEHEMLFDEYLVFVGFESKKSFLMTKLALS